MFGIFKLVIMTYQDLTKNKLIDDRGNYFMMGVTISLLSHFVPKLSYMLLLTVIVLALRHYVLKYKIVGEGDGNAILWIFLGFGLLGWQLLVAYCIIFISIYCTYMGLKTYVFKIEGSVAGFPVFLVSFIVAAVLLNWELVPL